MSHTDSAVDDSSESPKRTRKGRALCPFPTPHRHIHTYTKSERARKGVLGHLIFSDARFRVLCGVLRAATALQRRFMLALSNRCRPDCRSSTLCKSWFLVHSSCSSLQTSDRRGTRGQLAATRLMRRDSPLSTAAQLQCGKRRGRLFCPKDLNDCNITISGKYSCQQRWYLTSLGPHIRTQLPQRKSTS